MTPDQLGIYIDYPELGAPPEKSLTEYGSEKYHGSVATGYDAKREKSPKWLAEDRWVKDMLKDVPEGDWVLDCPVGTGRFLPYYKERGFLVRAIDISDDMLDQAKEKMSGKTIIFGKADVRETGLYNKSVDVAVMVRMSRWLNPDDFVLALRELQRVTRKRIIFTARVRNHPHERSYELMKSALDGWRFAQDAEGHEQDYRIIALEPDG